jgi:LysM repeat protein
MRGGCATGDEKFGLRRQSNFFKQTRCRKRRCIANKPERGVRQVFRISLQNLRERRVLCVYIPKVSKIELNRIELNRIELEEVVLKHFWISCVCMALVLSSVPLVADSPNRPHSTVRPPILNRPITRGKRPVRSTLYCLVAIAVGAVMLTSCTRNRPAPETESGSVAIDAPSVVTPVQETDNGEAVEEGAEPEVSTPTPDATDADAAPTGTPSPNAETIQYTVQAGDTLLSVATQFGTDLDTLRRLNFLVDDNIQVGQVLRVPLGEGYTAEGAPTPTAAPYYYTVQPGDTLYGIALKFDVGVPSIIEANGLLDQDSLIVGTELLIPGYPPSNAAGGEAPAEASASRQAVHVVQPGDTLSTIAENYGVAAAEIAAANNIQNWELLRVGQQLFIPGVTPEEAAEINQIVHVVQPGQGLLQIAVIYGVSAEEIAAANNIQNTDLIYPGQELVIP